MNTQATLNPAESQKSKSISTAQIECFSPSTGEKLGDVPAQTPTEVQAAVERARHAQKAWGNSSFKQRRAVLTHIMNHLLEHADELCDEIVKDSGKTYENALLGEILPLCTKIKWTVKNGEKHLKPEKVSSGMFPHKKARIEYRPLGVVACIIPWNYPLQNIISSLVTPLMAGNAVILKASEAVAWSTQRFQRITDEALQKEGFSTDTVQILNGFGGTGAALVRARVDKILFIGSVNNGRRIIEGSAEHLTPVVMELGGKDPLIVCDDADLDKAVHSALGGTFINLGQNCIASERVLVFDKIYDKFLAEVTKYATQMRQGVPERGGNVDVGAICTPQQIKVIDELVKDALAKGATAVAGGEVRRLGNGTYYPPTILTDLTDDMRIIREEVFGPVMLIFRVAGEKEAIELANSTDFGLHSSVITKNKQRGEKIADQLQAGATCINDFGLCYLNQDLPFGGVKYSGYGRMNGRDGLRSYTNHKAVLSDRFSFEIPPKLYPVGKFDYDSAKSSVNLMFSASFKTRCLALAQLAWIAVKKRFIG